MAKAQVHIPRLIQSHHLHGAMHGTHLVGRFNTFIAVKVSDLLSNMWFFWFCVILDLVELPAVIQAGSAVGWITYIAQTVIQLLALPALGAGQKLAQLTSDAQTKADHETLTAIHDLSVTTSNIQTVQLEILKRLDDHKETSK